MPTCLSKATICKYSWVTGRPLKSQDKWADALVGATKLSFEVHRQIIIDEMVSAVHKMEALAMFELAQRCRVESWRLWAFSKLCARQESITAAEGKKLGIDALISICSIRERLAREPREGCEGCIMRPRGSWWGSMKVTGLPYCACRTCTPLLDMIKGEAALNTRFE